MTAVAPIRSATPLVASASSSPIGTTGTPTLLPSAEKPTVPQMQDAMAQLYLVLSQLREQQAHQGKAQVDCTKAARDIAAREQQEALERARKAAEEGGFFDMLSKDIGLAGVAGLVTFNYPLVAADIAAHKLGLFEHLEEKVDLVDVAAVATGRWEVVAADVLLRKTELAPQDARDILAKCGIPKDAPGISNEDVKPIAKDILLANLMVLSIAATVLSCGTTGALIVALTGVALSYGGTVVAKEKLADGVLGEGSSQWVGLGMQIYGTAAMCTSGFAGGATVLPAAASREAARGAAIAKGIESMARGTDQVVTTIHERKRDDANVDAESARYRLARLERLIEQIIDGIKEVHESHRKAAETLQGAIDTANQTDLALANGIKG